MENSYTHQVKTKYIDSGMKGGPLLENKFGSLKDLLKVVLVEGFNKKYPTIITLDNTSKELILIFEEDHGYTFNQVLRLSGADEEIFNDDFRVIEARPKTLKMIFNKETVLTEVVSTVGFVSKVSPLGYDVVFEDIINKTICFKNKSTKSPAILKVIDALPPNGYDATWVKYARVVVGQNIDEYGNFINNEKSPYWIAYPDGENTGNGISGASGIHGTAKWDYAIKNNSYSTVETDTQRGSYPTDWRIIGDDKTFYLMIRSMGRSAYSFNLLGFGNYITQDILDTTNICLQARYGIVSADSILGRNFARTRNTFGVLDADYAGFLFTDIYKDSLTESTNRYRCTAFYGGSDNKNMPWKSSSIKSINPITGNWVASLIYIKDFNNYIRGYHRGIKLLYGLSDISDKSSSKNGDIVLKVQTPIPDSSTYETMPLLFTLNDWEDV